MSFIWTNLKSVFGEWCGGNRFSGSRRISQAERQTDTWNWFCVPKHSNFWNTVSSFQLAKALRQAAVLMWLLNTSLFRIPKTVLVRSNYLICLWKCIFILSIKCVVDTVSADLSWKIRWFFLIIVVCHLPVCPSVYTWHIFHFFKRISCTMQISTELNTIA